MSELILTKDANCEAYVETTITIDSVTVVTLNATGTNPSVATIYHAGALIATLRASQPEFTLTTLGDYTIVLSGNCAYAEVWTTLAVDALSFDTWIEKLCYTGLPEDADPVVQGIVTNNNRYQEDGALIGVWSPSPGADFFVSAVAQDPTTSLVYYFENPDSIGQMAICDWDTGGLLSDVPMSGITNTPLEFFTGAAYNPVTGEMWVKTNDDSNSPDDFYTVNLTTGVATYQFSHPNARILDVTQSGLAFDAAGNMYCDTGDDPDSLYILDTSTGAVLQTITATNMFSSSNGTAFDFHPVTDQLHLITTSNSTRTIRVYNIVGTTATQVDTYDLSNAGGRQFTFVSIPDLVSIKFTRVYTRSTDGTVTYVDYDLEGNPITLPDGVEVGDCCCNPDTDAPQEGVATTNLSDVTGAGAQSVAAGFQKVSISNLGPNPATVHGATLAIGQTVTFEGYWDPVANEFKRLDEIPYDDSGSTLSIATTL